MLPLHSSVDAHLGYFHILTIVKNAVRNMVHEYLSENSLLILLVIYPEVELEVHMVILFLII